MNTGQHYDREMAEVFIETLGMPEPDYVLGVGSGTHGAQTARALERIEQVLLAERPDILLVPGDVNSTLAGALAAAKLQIPVAHLEAGLRSFDETMPEELNRDPDRPALGVVLHAQPRGGGEPGCRGDRRGPGAFRGKHDDRLALPNAAGGGALGHPPPARRRTGLVPARDPAPPEARRRRPARADHCRTGAARREPHGRLSGASARPRVARRTAQGARATLVDPVGYVDFLALEAHALRSRSPIPVAFRKRRLTSASPASPSATTPSGR